MLCLGGSQEMVTDQTHADSLSGQPSCWISNQECPEMDTFYNSRPESGYLWSQKSKTLSVCVCVLCFPLLPFHVSIIYIVTYINCGPNAQAILWSQELSAWSDSLAALVCHAPQTVSTPWTVISVPPLVAETKTALSACLLHAHKARVHATGYNSPWCLHPTGYDLRFPFFPWPEAETYYFIHLRSGFPMWLKVKDAESVSVKVPDSISLLSVCTLAMREWGPGTVSAQSRSNLDVLLWGLSRPLPSGFGASHTHTQPQAHTQHTHTI